MEFNDLLFRNKGLKKYTKIVRFGVNGYEIEYFKNKSNKVYVYDDFDKGTIIETTEDGLWDLVRDVYFGRKIYGIEKHFDKILPNVFDGYVTHISDRKNRENILKKGLYPNGSLSMEIMMASCYLDSKRPRTIPKDFYRQMCIYTRPEETYSYLYHYDIDAEEDLYIIDISNYNWRIASEGLSGFCIPSWENDCFTPPNDLDKFCKLYWKNCFSKEDYLMQTNEVKKSDKKWGLDEILVPNHISSDDIILIGTFKNKQFHYFDIIKQFALNNFYEDFKESRNDF